MVAVGAGKLMTVFLILDVAADQLVRFADADEFLHAWHFFERARLYFPAVASNADGRALRARHGMGAVSQALDFLANRPHLFVR